MILMSDPQVAAIRTADNGEPLVDLRDVADLWLDDRLSDEQGAFARLRLTVAERLSEAQRRLPAGVRLLVVEGYRPRRLQESYFFGYRDGLRERYQDWGAQRLHVEASKFVAPPDLAPHGTGGAVDLTLCTEDRVELDMGTRVNDSPEASLNACYTAARNIPAAARLNRAMLWKALTEVGLVNYPTEWWHWSYGERYWALSSGVPNTLYGPVVTDLS
ncbi:M15 family metallopeptidase [Rugosimonospora acidiphila]|uniref:D-alanyl-D-alanine dipeptidase n=1 Tax=Rugosimonospora acidiphila TaxID=556531 RepID=A0ABP9SKZ2_9ACTN